MPKAKVFKDREKILKHLSLIKILEFFKFEKTASIYETPDKIICSSPFSQDTSPSFHFHKDMKVFFCFSTGRGGDLFELIALLTGLSCKSDFKKIVFYAKKTAGLLNSDSEQQQGCYVLDERGLWFNEARESGEEDKYWIASYLNVVAQTRNLQGVGWGRLLELKDSEGRLKTWPMPMDMLAGDGRELRKTLLHLGARLQPTKKARNHLLHYLSTKEVNRFCRAIDRLGWVDESFVMPQKVYSKGGINTQVVLAQPENFAKVCTSGSLKEWQQNIAQFCKGNSILQLSLAAAFAPVLLNLMGHDNFGLHLVGGSSIGKTISLDVAGSVWGGSGARGFKNRWRSTVNGLEALAARHNDCLLVLDELGEVSPKTASAAAYMLANGSGKIRSLKEGGLSNQIEWRTIFLSAGEVNLNTHLDSEGQKTRAGQQVRMISLEADQGKGFGCFENIHDFPSSAEFADQLRAQSQCYFGAPIEAFLENIVKQTDCLQLVRSYQKEFKDNFVKTRQAGKVLRVLDHFSLLYASVAMASNYGIVPVEQAELKDSLSKLLETWINDVGQDLQEEREVINQIVSYLQTYGPSRFPLIDTVRENLDMSICAGFRRISPEGDMEWLILSEVFKKEVCKGFNQRSVVKFLKESKFLNVDNDKSSSSRVRLPILGRTRVFRICESLLNF